jgi:hypothetical protein
MYLGAASSRRSPVAFPMVAAEEGTGQVSASLCKICHLLGRQPQYHCASVHYCTSLNTAVHHCTPLCTTPIQSLYTTGTSLYLTVHLCITVHRTGTSQCIQYMSSLCNTEHPVNHVRYRLTTRRYSRAVRHFGASAVGVTLIAPLVRVMIEITGASCCVTVAIVRRLLCYAVRHCVAQY